MLLVGRPRSLARPANRIPPMLRSSSPGNTSQEAAAALLTNTCGTPHAHSRRVSPFSGRCRLLLHAGMRARGKARNLVHSQDARLDFPLVLSQRVRACVAYSQGARHARTHAHITHSRTCAYTHTCTRARARTHTHTCTHTHVRTPSRSVPSFIHAERERERERERESNLPHEPDVSVARRANRGMLHGLNHTRRPTARQLHRAGSGTAHRQRAAAARHSPGGGIATQPQHCTMAAQSRTQTDAK